MKKIVLVLAIALMGIAMNAQSPRHHHDKGGNPEQMVERRVDHLNKIVGLTEAQKAEVVKIYTQEIDAMAKEREALSAQGQKARPDEAEMKARREKMESRRAATDAKIEALLTPEQAAKYAEFKSHKGDQRHGRHHDGDRDRAKKHHDGDRKAGKKDCCGGCNATCDKDK